MNAKIRIERLEENRNKINRLEKNLKKLKSNEKTATGTDNEGETFDYQSEIKSLENQISFLKKADELGVLSDLEKTDKMGAETYFFDASMVVTHKKTVRHPNGKYKSNGRLDYDDFTFKTTKEMFEDLCKKHPQIFQLVRHFKGRNMTMDTPLKCPKHGNKTLRDLYKEGIGEVNLALMFSYGAILDDELNQLLKQSPYKSKNKSHKPKKRYKPEPHFTKETKFNSKLVEIEEASSTPKYQTVEMVGYMGKDGKVYNFTPRTEVVMVEQKVDPEVDFFDILFEEDDTPVVKEIDYDAFYFTGSKTEEQGARKNGEYIRKALPRLMKYVESKGTSAEPIANRVKYNEMYDFELKHYPKLDEWVTDFYRKGSYQDGNGSLSSGKIIPESISLTVFAILTSKGYDVEKVNKYLQNVLSKPHADKTPERNATETVIRTFLEGNKYNDEGWDTSHDVNTYILLYGWLKCQNLTDITLYDHDIKKMVKNGVTLPEIPEC